LGIDLKGTEAILNKQEEVDPILNHLEQDNRLGLTLLISLQCKITEKIGIVQEKIAKIEPTQYFYPASDIHMTILDIISASSDYERDEAQIKKLISIIERVIIKLPSFTIRFQGLAVSKGAILIKGYYNQELQQLRSKIRRIVTEEGIDFKERYQSLSAHVTIARFKTILNNREKLLELIEEYRDLEIGSVTINELDLVVHDWYNAKKEIIYKFVLNS
jgi:2'-5' RNA ligase